MTLAADRARARGNVVRSAIRRARAAAWDDARADLAALAGRLRPALELTDKEEAEWRDLLPALLPAAARGVWPVEARLLYDLQKVCTDRERELFAVDVLGWLRSFGRSQLKRPLPEQREMLLLRHLRAAERRLAAAQLSDDARGRLTALFAAAVARTEARLRTRFRPLVVAALDEVGLIPRHLPEQVARDGVVEGLLDRALARGYLALGDLRDALSGSQLKLPDVGGPGEWLRGDRLLRADARLAEMLAGVHHRGEVYLRLLQRLSAIAFGTAIGRFAVLYLLLPFGGAFVTLVGGESVWHHVVAFAADGEDGSDAEAATQFEPPALWTVALLGLFFFALMHVPAFRRAVGRALGLLGRALKGLLYDLPAAALRWPPLRRLVASRIVTFLGRFVLKPGLAAGVALVLLRRFGPPTMLYGALGTFVAANVFFNSRIGPVVERAFADLLALTWRRVGREFLPALLHFFLDTFKLLISGWDRVRYTVDEWLRFRSGQGRLAFAVKAVLGPLWGVVAYLVRTNVVLWIEPQINPVKHVPTVTVAAKLMLPALPLLEALFEPLGSALAWTLLTFSAVFIPGFAGFAVWELRENWRLYAANRKPTLSPVAVGSHGETVPRLLRRGFHSGTVPKLFAKLRRAEEAGRADAVRKHHAALHHVAEDVRRFLEREFFALVNASPPWRATPLGLGDVHVTAQALEAELFCPLLGDGAGRLRFEEQSGGLSSHFDEPDWLARASTEQRQALTAALAGLDALTGVDGANEVSWDEWVATWEGDGSGSPSRPEPVSNLVSGV